MKKVIFLDIDGVINNSQTKNKSPKGYIGLDNELVDRLKCLVDISKADIVLTSSWKEESEDDVDWKYLVDTLKNGGIKISDKTNDKFKPSRRGEGILRYLSEHTDINEFVILDDFDFDFYSLGLYPHFVWSDPNNGITTDNVNVAFEVLNGQLRDEKELNIELGYQHS